MKYDFTFLLGEEKHSKQVKQMISSLAGQIIKESAWGKKHLSYPIKKLTDAYYFNWLIEIDQKKILELKKKLNFDEKLLRYLLLKAE